MGHIMHVDDIVLLLTMFSMKKQSRSKRKLCNATHISEKAFFVYCAILNSIYIHSANYLELRQLGASPKCNNVHDIPTFCQSHGILQNAGIAFIESVGQHTHSEPAFYNMT